MQTQNKYNYSQEIIDKYKIRFFERKNKTVFSFVDDDGERYFHTNEVADFLGNTAATRSTLKSETNTKIVKRLSEIKTTMPRSKYVQAKTRFLTTSGFLQTVCLLKLNDTDEVKEINTWVYYNIIPIITNNGMKILTTNDYTLINSINYNITSAAVALSVKKNNEIMEKFVSGKTDKTIEQIDMTETEVQKYPNIKNGVIYAYQPANVEENVVKLGRSSDIKSRMKQLNTAHMTDGRLVHYELVNDTINAEKMLHAMLYKNNIRREFYKVEYDLLVSAMKLCKHLINGDGTEIITINNCLNDQKKINEQKTKCINSISNILNF